MNFPNDGSAQIITTITPIGNYNPLISSNDLSTSLTSYQTLLNSTCNLLGVGTAITALDYNKITVNKPTNFQADWNTLIINKPALMGVTSYND